LGANELEDL
jgi:hypothetical protein